MYFTPMFVFIKAHQFNGTILSPNLPPLLRWVLTLRKHCNSGPSSSDISLTQVQENLVLQSTHHISNKRGFPRCCENHC